MHKAVPVFLTLTLAGLPALAADADGAKTYQVGDPAVEAAIFQPYKHTFRIDQFSAAGASLPNWGKATDEMVKVEENGRTLFKRTQVTYLPKKTVTEIVVFDAQDLTPVWTEETDTTGVYQHYDFTGPAVTIERSSEPPGGERKRSEVKLDRRVYDFNGGLYGLLLAALPSSLPAGTVVRLPVFDEEPPEGAEWQAFKVLGKETLEIGGKKVETAAVETQLGTFRVVFNLAKQPPYTVRITNYGPGGGRQVFETDWQ